MDLKLKKILKAGFPIATITFLASFFYKYRMFYYNAGDIAAIDETRNYN